MKTSLMPEITRWPRFYALTFISCISVVPLLAQSNPGMTVGADRITVSGVTPNAQVVFFARTIVYSGGVPVRARHAFVERDDDGDGSVTAVLETVPRSSVWVAVDAESGGFATGAPVGFEPRTVVVSPATWREYDAMVDLRRERLDFLLVRPKKGAWTLDVFQGSTRDDDGRNDANLRLRTSSMQPLLGKDSPPPHAVKKDVLVMIDPFELAIAVVAAQ